MRSTVLSLALATCFAATAWGAEITVVTPGFVIGGMRTLAASYQAKTGNKVTVSGQGMGSMMSTIKARGDVVVLPADLMQTAIEQGGLTSLQSLAAGTDQQLADYQRLYGARDKAVAGAAKAGSDVTGQTAAVNKTTDAVRQAKSELKTLNQTVNAMKKQLAAQQKAAKAAEAAKRKANAAANAKALNSTAKKAKRR